MKAVIAFNPFQEVASTLQELLLLAESGYLEAVNFGVVDSKAFDSFATITLSDEYWKVELPVDLKTKNFSPPRWVRVLLALGWTFKPESENVLIRRFAPDVELLSLAWSALDGLIISQALVEESWFSFGLEEQVLKVVSNHSYQKHPTVEGIFRLSEDASRG
jgi:hypothetical protein